MVRIEYVPDGRGDEDAAQIRDLLATVDDEFVPPLSAREGTTQTADLDDCRASGMESYVENLLDQFLALAKMGSDLVGVLSFREDYEAPDLGAHCPANYVTTVAVAPTHRREGVARTLYRWLLTDLPVADRAPFVATRSWGTSEAHLALLADLGFEEIARIENDRGEGIDTVYLCIARSE